MLDDLRALLGATGEPTFRAFHLWPKAIPQYDLTYGRFKDIMDEVERRNPGFALAGSYREGVALGEAIASGEEAAVRVAGAASSGGIRRPVSPPLRVGTRASALALWQTEHVRARLHAAGYATERVEIRTTGDMVQHVPLAQIGSRALFTRQIDDAMLEGRIDLAVHSLKDLPTTLPDGIALVAVGEREDPSDALVGRGPIRWSDLPEPRSLATSSLRRRAQLLHAPARSPGPRHPRQRGHPARQARRERGVVRHPARRGGARAARPRRPDRRSGCRPRSCCRRRARARWPSPRAPDDAACRRRRGAGGPPSADRARGGRGAGVPPDARGRLPGAGRGARGADAQRHGSALHGRVVSLRGERGVEGDRDRSGARTKREADEHGRSRWPSGCSGDGAASILAEVRGRAAPAVPEP